MPRRPLPTTPPVLPIASVRPGTRLICDGGFTCMRVGDVRDVMQDSDGYLYVTCKEGTHWLAGQRSGENYVGFWLANAEPAGGGQ